MQLESHATPPRETPQQRYANLHRALERGLDSDEIWKELVEVSLKLGHSDEAARCVRRIGNEATRLALQSRLERLGLCASSTDRPTGAPAASDAGTEASDGAGVHRLRDHVLDAFQYLLHQHMPWLVLVTTLAFPVVIGIGGFLTAGGSWFLLAGIAALPGLCVLGLVGAMSRQILLASASGDSDVPAIPGFATLVTDARRFFADLGLVVGALIGPAVVAAWLGTPWSTLLPGLLIGAYFAPMAWILRHLQNDLKSLSPVRLVRAVARAGLPYAAVAPVVLLLFAPASLAAAVSFGSPIWLQIAIVGPLSVLPLFVSARLLGTWIDTRRSALGVRASAPKAEAPTPAQSPAARQSPPRLPKRPAALEHFRAPSLRRDKGKTSPAAKPTPGRSATPREARPVAGPKPASARAIEGRAPTPPTTAHPADAISRSSKEHRLPSAPVRQP